MMAKRKRYPIAIRSFEKVLYLPDVSLGAFCVGMYIVLACRLDLRCELAPIVVDSLLFCGIIDVWYATKGTEMIEDCARS